MKINKQLFEDVLSGKLKGTFTLRNGFMRRGNQLGRNDNGLAEVCPYCIQHRIYHSNGKFGFTDRDPFDIVDFIPDTIEIDPELYPYNQKDIQFIEHFINDYDMKQNELTIEIPNGKIVDWEESQKQNKIVLKDKQLTYEDICKKLFNNNIHYTDVRGGIISNNVDPTNVVCITDANNASSKHQLECILAKNKLANVAKYLNDGWKSDLNADYGYFICNDPSNLGVLFLIEKLGVNCVYSSGAVAFKNSELAQQAIEILGEETIKLALEPLGI